MNRPHFTLICFVIAHTCMWCVTMAVTHAGVMAVTHAGMAESEQNMVDLKATWISFGLYGTSMAVGLTTCWRLAAWYYDGKRTIEEYQRNFEKLIDKIDRMQETIDENRHHDHE